MKQHGSINAMLANERLPVAQSPASQSTTSTSTSPPTSPTWPTSPSGRETPSFSWPRRVRSPEPYVPLRKASPERLRNRRGAVPHPIFVHTHGGSQGYAPGTSSGTAAVPYHTPVYAAPERDDEHDHDHHHHHEQHEHNPYQATGYGRSGPPPITPTIRQPPPPRQIHSVESSRKVSWPLPMEDDGSGSNRRVFSSQSHHYPHQRGMTPSPTWHRKPGGPLKTSRSMQEGLRAASGRQGRCNGRLSPAPPSPGIQYPYSVQEEEEVRASFRSAMTSGSSQVASTIGTSRSSVATADSSFSEYIKIDSPASGAASRDSQAYESDFDVDDALDLYAAGFETPIRASADVSRRASVDSGRSAPFRPHPSHPSHPSPLRSNRLGVKADHRRSRSASHLDMTRIRAEESSQNALPALPKPLASNIPNVKPSSAGHMTTSTVQIVTKQSSAAPSPQSQPAPAPAPAPAPQAAPPPHPDVYLTPPPPPPRDRYGFKKNSHNYTPQDFEAWEKGYDEHLAERRVKWEALMKKFGLSTKNPTRFPPKSDKVKKYIRKGIPPEWRGAAWFWYAGGPSKLARDPGLYWNLLNKVKEGELSETDREHIERDLNRTFPDNDRFRPDPVTARDSHTDTSKSAVENGQKETDMVCALRRVLQAFAVHNPNIGYCQSLNFIAGLLLIFLNADEEKAFILLNVVTTEHLPGTHGVALEGANIDIAVLMSSIKESIPSVWTKLDDRQPTNSIIGGPPRLPTVSLATTAWFMSLFVGTLPIECVLRVWDCLFFEGSKTLFRVALAIFKLGEPGIRAISDPMEIFQEVQSMPRKILDANALMEVCFRKRHGFGGLSQDAVEKRREERRRDVKEGRTFDDVSHSGMGSKLRKVKSSRRFKIH